MRYDEETCGIVLEPLEDASIVVVRRSRHISGLVVGHFSALLRVSRRGSRQHFCSRRPCLSHACISGLALRRIALLPVHAPV
jgi:hypothetical protein